MSRHALGLTTVAALLLGGMTGPALAQCDDDDEFTTDFRFSDCTFASDGRNPYFSLDPGDKLVLEEDDEDGVRLEVTVLSDRKWVHFVTPGGQLLKVRTRVVEEREWEGDELVEVSRNFFARCKETNDIFYFGEQTFVDGAVAPDSWEAGVNGALPGLIMPGTFLLGSKYFQEQAPGAALDRGEHVAMGLQAAVPAGVFDGCVEVLDTNALDCDGEGDVKTYCPGIGLVIDEDAQLTELEIGDDEDEDDDDDRRGDRRRHRR